MARIRRNFLVGGKLFPQPISQTGPLCASKKKLESEFVFCFSTCQMFIIQETYQMSC